jgi:dehydrogenase/reductase SDR family member 4
MTNDLFSLEGKVAIVTGASKGIGEAIVKLYAAAGAKVVVSSRKLEAVEPIAHAIRSEGGEAIAVACHAGNIADIVNLVEVTVKHFGTIDILVNNAATNPVFGPVVNTSEDAFDKIMNVNVKGPFELAKKAYPFMKQKKSGSVINISSIGGLRPEPGLGIYSVSKAALISLTKVMAKEWGEDNIRANVICPGLIKTKFSEALWSNEAILKYYLKQTPLGRIGEPQEIANLALFLASDASTYSTGAMFMADGGILQ